MAKITTDDWIAELARLGATAQHDAERKTAAEIAEALGVCRRVALVRMKGWMTAGVLRCSGKRSTRRIDGQRDMTPVYAPVAKGQV